MRDEGWRVNLDTNPTHLHSLKALLSSTLQRLTE